MTKREFVPPGTPAADRFRLAVERANRKWGGGEVCHGCRRPLASGERTVIGADRRHKLRVVGSCCSGMLQSIHGFGMFIRAADAPADYLNLVPTRGRA
jgi:hypothetical protein